MMLLLWPSSSKCGVFFALLMLALTTETCVGLSLQARTTPKDMSKRIASACERVFVCVCYFQ